MTAAPATPSAFSAYLSDSFDESKLRQAREMVNSVTRVLWYDEESGRCVARLRVDAVGEVAVGTIPSRDFFSTQNIYRFLGRWQESERGTQFLFDAVMLDRPNTFQGMVKYLVENAPNVGAATADKLARKYYLDAVRILRETPSLVFADGIMSLDAACEAGAALAKVKRFEQTTIELHQLFSNYGFGGRGITASIERWGTKAPQVIARNPFALLVADIPGAGFKRCDKLWCELKLRPNALKRQMLCAWNYLRLGNDGHTWYRAEDVCQYVVDTIAGGAAAVDPIRAITLGRRAGWLRVHRDSNGRAWIAEAEKATNERKIADSLERLQAWKGERLWPDDLPVSQVDGDRLPSEHQAKKAATATARAVGILCGGPGTGKTHTLSYILRTVIERIGVGNVAVAAPTGKASVRATQALQLCGLTDLRATTIHRLLKIGRNGHDGRGWGFQHNRANPLPHRVVVVDEASMIDTDLFAALLEACADGTHVLIIGDPFQLPPVGHGAPLRDMIAAGVPTGELREVRRNAGAIVHACVRIKAGEQFDTYPEFNPEVGHNLLFAETKDEAETLELLTTLASGMKTFHPVWQTQVLVGVNKKSILSRTLVNDRLHGLLNPDGRTVTGNPFKVGDKVICLRNGEYQTVAPVDDALAPEELELADNYHTEKLWVKNTFGNMEPDPDPAMVYVANGEIGRVVAISAKVAVVRVGEADTLVKVQLRKEKSAGEAAADEEGGGGGGEDKEGESKGRQSNWDLAYAITTHKSQGSESPCVIILADPSAGRVADRNWYYTAISRASRLCIIIGQRAVVDRQRMRQSLVKRKTFLCELLRSPTEPPPP